MKADLHAKMATVSIKRRKNFTRQTSRIKEGISNITTLENTKSELVH